MNECVCRIVRAAVQKLLRPSCTNFQWIVSAFEEIFGIHKVASRGRSLFDRLSHSIIRNVPGRVGRAIDFFAVLVIFAVCFNRGHVQLCNVTQT